MTETRPCLNVVARHVLQVTTPKNGARVPVRVRDDQRADGAGRVDRVPRDIARAKDANPRGRSRVGQEWRSTYR